MTIRIGYGGWLGHSNLGDEACFEEVGRAIRRGFGAGASLAPLSFDQHQKIDFAIIGGGTILSTFCRPMDKRIVQLRDEGVPYAIFGSGVEQLDVETIVDWVDITNGSEGVSLLRHNLEGARLVGLRDVRSLDVVRMVAPGIGAALSGDPTLLLNVQSLSDLQGVVVADTSVAVSIGTSCGNIYGRDEGKVVEEAAKIVDVLTSYGYHVYLFSVWPPDVPLNRAVYERCVRHEQLHELLPFQDYRDLVGTLRKMDLVVGMKLHSIIFSLLAEVPAVSIAYREKCIAMMETFNLEEYVVRTDAADLSGDSVRAFLKAKESRSALVARIRQTKEVLSAQARLMFDSLVHEITSSVCPKP